MTIDNQIKYNICPRCNKSHVLNSGVHYCHIPMSKRANIPTIEELEIRIERLEHNYRELLKALQQGEPHDK